LGVEKLIRNSDLRWGDILEIAHEAYFFCLFSEFEFV
jgi:hypothetical protein